MLTSVVNYNSLISLYISELQLHVCFVRSQCCKLQSFGFVTNCSKSSGEKNIKYELQNKVPWSDIRKKNPTKG